MPARKREIILTLVFIAISAICILVLSSFELTDRLLTVVMKSGLSSLWSMGAIVSARKADLAWYPPSNTSINNLTVALYGEGVYGFIFNTSNTPDAQYGTYNWCNMPHVRKTEYVRATSEYRLIYVEIIQRHHKRTPYASNAFPVESYPWDCNDQGLYYYGRPFGNDRKQPAEVFWGGYISQVNPFTPSGWVGTCQFPQITSAGLDDSWIHGRDLYGVYHDLLGFLPGRSEDWKSSVTYRVTQNVITSQVAGMLINGMWQTSEAVPLIVQGAGVDSLEPQYSCKVGGELFNTIKSSSNAAWERHLEDAADLFSKLDSISGVLPGDSGFHASFDHYFDNLSARECHAKPLPCKLEGGVNSSTCVDQAVANAVYRIGQWEYSQIYRDSSASLAASTATYGVWVAELSKHLRDAMARKGGPIYFHNIAHDGSISRLLSILQIDIMVWPGMGSELAFELYERDGNTTVSRDPRIEPHVEVGQMPPKGKYNGGFFVRVLFGGKPLRSSNPSLGLLDMVPAETLLAYFDGLVGTDASLVLGKCNGTLPV